jgi:hypothetical protein
MKRFIQELWESKETRIALILSLALITSVIIYCFGTRYQMIRPAGDSDGMAYMYDRMTGSYWFCGPDFYMSNPKLMK